MDSQLIISVGREFGSAGHEIAQHLADHYQIPLYDSNLLNEVALEKNLDLEKLQDLADYLSDYSCVRRVDLLPFHKMGSRKWQSIGLTDPLENIQPPSPDDVRKAEKIFEAFNKTFL